MPKGSYLDRNCCTTERKNTARIGQVVLVALLIASVVSLSLLQQPDLTASYQETHGPTTTFRGLRFQRLLLASIAAAAGSVAGYLGPCPDSPRSVNPSAPGSVLLC